MLEEVLREKLGFEFVRKFNGNLEEDEEEEEEKELNEENDSSEEDEEFQMSGEEEEKNSEKIDDNDSIIFSDNPEEAEKLIDFSINQETEIFETDVGKIFVKFGSKELVSGEHESLSAIKATSTISCPTPLTIIQCGETYGLVTPFIEMDMSKTNTAILGEKIAKMHLHNKNLLELKKRSEKFVGNQGEAEMVEMFGFPVPTCCGKLPQTNDWIKDWTTFFIRNRLDVSICRLVEKGNRDLLDKKEFLYRKVEKMLKCRENVVPSLVHGDLWGGNFCGMTNGEQIVFDPASSFADPEFEQGIMSLFGVLSSDFLKEYHKHVEMQKNREKRMKLYELYHLLNHWDHFGASYKNSAKLLIDEIISGKYDE